MRIVMLTDDKEIDRRILIEAKSLVDVGHEVIVIAKQNSTDPLFEQQHGVKIERLPEETPPSPVYHLSLTPYYDVPESEKGPKPNLYEHLPYSSLRDALRSIRGSLRWMAFLPRRVAQAIILTDFLLIVLRKMVAAKLNAIPLVRSWRATSSAGFLDTNDGQFSAIYAGLPYHSLRGALQSINKTFLWMHVVPRRIIHGVIFADFLLRVIRRMLVLKLKGLMTENRPKRSAVEYYADFTLADFSPAHRVSHLRLNYWERALLERLLFYRPDVVHVHDLPQLAAGVEAKSALECTLVYDAHEIYPQIGTLTSNQRLALDAKERALVKSVDHMITVNPFIADWYAKEYAMPRPTSIRNSVSPQPGMGVLSRTTTLRDLLQLDASARILIFQGWLDASRGLASLIRAMADVPDNIHLVFIGYGEFITEAKKLAAGQKKRIHFVPKVTFEELTDYTLSADAGIIPYPDTDLNHHFCSPNKLFEFIHAGLPIIGNRLPYLEQVIDGEGFGLTEPLHGPKDYARAIRRMFDPALGGPERFHAALAGKRDQYLWDSTDKHELLGVYQRIAAANVRSSGQGAQPVQSHAQA